METRFAQHIPAARSCRNRTPRMRTRYANARCDGRIISMDEMSSSRMMAAIVIVATLIAIAAFAMLPNPIFASMLPSIGQQDQTERAVDESTDDESSAKVVDKDLLTLVNRWNPVPEGRHIDLVEIEGNQKVDARCAEDLQEMLDRCRSDGNDPVICSAYRTQDYQQKLFDEEVAKYERLGFSEKYATKRAERSVAIPGTSEHQIGLAVDIVDEGNQLLDSSQERTSTQKWLLKNCWRYGFILRYPTGKESVTGIIYEPWHYRYVGRSIAEEIHESGLCLEEFLSRYQGI